MDKIKIQTDSAEIFYSGVFELPAFDLMAIPGSQLYKAVIGKLSPYGAALSTLKLDNSSLSDTNISCGLPIVNGLFRARLDRFDLNFSRYHEVGMELANMILTEAWGIISTSDPSIVLREHRINLNISSRMVDRPFHDLVTRFVQVPAGFPDGTQAAVGYYFLPDETTGLRLFSLIMDRTPDPQMFTLRIEVGFRGDLAAPSAVGTFIDTFLQKQFEILGMSWE